MNVLLTPSSNSNQPLKTPIFLFIKIGSVCLSYLNIYVRSFTQSESLILCLHNRLYSNIIQSLRGSITRACVSSFPEAPFPNGEIFYATFVRSLLRGGREGRLITHFSESPASPSAPHFTWGESEFFSLLGQKYVPCHAW